MAISAKQVKELREKTGAGMMDCKKALTETDGDMAKAVDWLREKGKAKAEKKANRVAAEGLTRVATNGNKAVIYEVNSETDFVAKNEQFLSLLDTMKDAFLTNDVVTVEDALVLETPQGTINDLLVDATATIGEKITLRRLAVVTKTDEQQFGTYMHNGGAISALVVMEGATDEIAKNMAMQVASMRPTYVSQADVPAEVVEHETEVQKQIMAADPKLEGKPEKVLEGILKGKVSKHFQDECLMDQEYFLEPKKKVSAFLKEHKCSVVEFIRYQAGEGLEKREDDFAAEVAAQMAAAK
ncbi:translation elongation factor Ts [Ileibacterium valens]|uniref:Elongation factor Ts n=1 Tax=Ileibacterium valens TaxID=1862668 RepID=A0A1U7NHA2_9FIRM|nr:translation elongation factor Ts [Ileibacterium valens]OLU36246.1 translation elongation factor Ts [Erysipelotrichaceae bacterium NYU-BL-E8]OLU37164.1 translation elongation factor Ts [Erysipelotrichaceae bacterium NYU-BL-F16]OLU41028.1 translation elongation factor Ts [Ileibacterium valens]